LFLDLRIPARSAMKFRKERIDKILSFILENIRRDIVVLIYIEVHISCKECPGVPRLVGVTDFSNPSKGLNDLSCKECTKEGEVQITRGYCECRKECMQESF
jgi:hypothetical protein